MSISDFQKREIEKRKTLTRIISLITVVSLVFIASLMAGCPIYNVWQQGLVGEAALKRASQEKQIMIEQAKAEVIAAEQRALAINAVGSAIREFPEYREQEFIGAFAQALEDGNIHQIIYVPTEANIPIMEAGRSMQ
jgi:hypothetical protein